MATGIKQLDNDKVEIETSRLQLRGAVDGDEEALNEAFSNVEVMRYWSVSPGSED